MVTGVVTLKLGGSLITDKERPATAREEVIRRLAAELARALDRTPGAVVIGHGSGSFGHPPAARYRLRDGLRGEDDLEGVSLTQSRADELHRLVFDALREAGVASFSLAPAAGAVAEDGRLRTLAVEPVAIALERGLVPLVHGDVVADRVRGVTVASTEQVLEHLATGLAGRGWRVRRAVWLGDTAGVFDGEDRVIPRIAAGDGLPDGVGPSGATDVTGGMAHRLEVALRLARRGIPSWIGDGRREGALEEALRGEARGGTRVVPER